MFFGFCYFSISLNDRKYRGCKHRFKYYQTVEFNVVKYKFLPLKLIYVLKNKINLSSGNSTLQAYIAIEAKSNRVFWNVHSYMCWINNGRKKIECANYDGSDRKEVVKSGLHNPIGLVVDAMSGYYVTITVISRFLVFTISRCFFLACLHYIKYTRNALTLRYL